MGLWLRDFISIHRDEAVWYMLKKNSESAVESGSLSSLREALGLVKQESKGLNYFYHGFLDEASC